MRAISLREHERGTREEAALVGQATGVLHRPSENRDPGYLTRVSPGILAPPPAPIGTLNASRWPRRPRDRFGIPAPGLRAGTGSRTAGGWGGSR
jgi:hypothetical protein